MSDVKTFNGEQKIKLTQLINEGMAVMHEIDTLNGGSAVKSAGLAALWTAQGWDLVDTTARIFNVSWGSGSSSATGKVYMGLYYGDSNNTYLYMGTVDTGNNDWQTPGADISSGPPYIALGTWLLPATFTLYTPEIASPGNWC